jgi:phosphotransferase system  glucose/maltose/N-acetylglucosamine-specific IIC component
MIYASRLRFYEPFFPMKSSVFVLCCFFLNPMSTLHVCITGHIHHSIVDKIDPTSEYAEMAKKNTNLINYIGLHIFVKCDQKNLFTVPSIDQ